MNIWLWESQRAGFLRRDHAGRWIQTPRHHRARGASLAVSGAKSRACKSDYRNLTGPENSKADNFSGFHLSRLYNQPHDTQNNTVIIGGGAWGSAIAHQLRMNRDQDYTLLVRAPAAAQNLKQGTVSQHPELPKLPGFQVTTDRACLRDADLVYLVVPVSAHDEMLALIDSYTSKMCSDFLCKGAGSRCGQRRYFPA